MAQWGYSAPQRHGNAVSLRVSLRIWNLGQQDLRGGTLNLDESIDVHKHVTLASVIDVQKGQSRTFRVYVDISREEFQRWEKGSKPVFSVSYYDAQGDLRVLPVDVSKTMEHENEN
jgi:hypothetical protein